MRGLEQLSDLYDALVIKVNSFFRINELPGRVTSDGTEYVATSRAVSGGYEETQMLASTFFKSPFKEITADYTLTVADKNTQILVNGDGITLTIPDDLGTELGNKVTMLVQGTGFAISSSGAVTEKYPVALTDLENSIITIVKTAANTFQIAQIGAAGGGTTYESYNETGTGGTLAATITTPAGLTATNLSLEDNQILLNKSIVEFPYVLEVPDAPAASRTVTFPDKSGTVAMLDDLGGATLTKDVNQVVHGLSVGNVIRLDGSNYVKAQADSVNNANAISFVVSVTDVDNFVLQSEGYTNISLGLSNGDEAFLSTTELGGIQTTEPLEGEVNLYLGQKTPQGFLISISTGFIVEGSSNDNYTNGFIDYNDTTGSVSLTANTWATIPNNGAGSFSNNTYKPEEVTELIDVSTGAIDTSELHLGDVILIRNDFQINPNTNNALLEFRYQLGAGANAYNLETNLGRLDDGSGKNYRFSLKPDLIYMGDANTKDNPIVIQVKLSTNGTLTNAGSAITLIKRNIT